jgi:RNA polymerase sigma factor (sigma-70 family)
MPEWTQAEQFLLEQIRQGNQDAWSQLVERYQGRLLAFARRRAPKSADPEDLVQDTFLLFLRGLPTYRGQASVETYLFLILRRRIIELLRVRRMNPCQLPDSPDGDDSRSGNFVASDPTASWYVRRDEQREAARMALTSALQSLVENLHAELNFRDLQILEMLFYAQRPNRDIAALLNVGAEHVAMVKHRWLKQARERVSHFDRVTQAEPATPDATSFDSLLTEIWEDQRPSCPKRNTIGGYLLNTLDDPWQTYVDFHIKTLGCSFCRANLEDLQKQTRQDPQSLRRRILQSTVGFLTRP